MNKPELVDSCAMKLGSINRIDVERSVDLILDMIAEKLETGDRVEIRGFGSFKTTVRNARRSRNPKTNEKLQTVEKVAIHFKPGSELRLRVNGGEY